MCSSQRIMTLTLGMWQDILRYYFLLDNLHHFFSTLPRTRKETSKQKMEGKICASEGVDYGLRPMPMNSPPAYEQYRYREETFRNIYNNLAVTLCLLTLI